MSRSIVPVRTRFRAYQLGVAGSSFSYFAGNHFTLIEAMATETSKPLLLEELRLCGVNAIDTLHITSWDADHCSPQGLEWILNYLCPKRIEYPGYAPHTDTARVSLAVIQTYQRKWSTQGHSIAVQAVNPQYIDSLEHAKALGYRNIFYHPRQLQELSNNNSTIKFFRTGSFNVLSLGDVEDPAIGAMLRRCTSLCRELDVMILAHHGADNGFTTKALLEALQPAVAICSSNYDNKHDHPRDEIRNLLFQHGVRLYTSKTGDVIVESVGLHTMDYQVTNLGGQSTQVLSQDRYRARKARLLAMNSDTVRNVLHPGFKGLVR